MTNEVTDNRSELRKLKRERERFLVEIAEKQARYDEISNKASKLRSSLGENSKNIQRN